MLQNVEVNSDERESAKALEFEPLGRRIGCRGTLHLDVAYLLVPYENAIYDLRVNNTLTLFTWSSLREKSYLKKSLTMNPRFFSSRYSVIQVLFLALKEIRQR